MRYYLIIILSSVFILSCKKQGLVVKTGFSLTVINASPGISNAKVATLYTGYYKDIAGVNYNNSAVYTLPTGSTPVKVVSISDTTKALFNNTIQAKDRSIYSLFIAGAAGEDIILTEDQLPLYNFHSASVDSSLGVRFVNLVSNGSPVNVTLSSSPATNEFTAVAYKSVTDFKTYPALSSNPDSYTFQVRDAGGNLLASSSALSKTALRFKSVTVVYRGVIGGSGASAPGILVVNNF